jgi:hypothetical protein
MGSDLSGDQRGQVICNAAAGQACKHLLRKAGCRAGSRSDFTMQQKWCKRPIQNSYRRDQFARRDLRNVAREKTFEVLNLVTSRNETWSDGSRLEQIRRR